MDLKQYKNVHFVGIGGIGVSALAEIAKSQGLSVSGSDMKESEVTQMLEANGIKVFIGHAAENVDNADILNHRN